MKKLVFATACAFALSMTAASAQVGGGAGSPPSAQSGGTIQNPNTAKDAAPKGTTGASKNSDGTITPGNGNPTTTPPNASGGAMKK